MFFVVHMCHGSTQFAVRHCLHFGCPSNAIIGTIYQRLLQCKHSYIRWLSNCGICIRCASYFYIHKPKQPELTPGGRLVYISNKSQYLKNEERYEKGYMLLFQEFVQIRQGKWEIFDLQCLYAAQKHVSTQIVVIIAQHLMLKRVFM